MRSLSQSSKIMQAVIAALFAYGLLMWAVAEARKATSRDDLRVEVASLRSNVSEAMKVLDSADRGALTPQYFRVETEMLHEKLAGVAKTLGSVEPEPGLEGPLGQARALAERAVKVSKDLNSSFEESSTLKKAGAELAEIFGRAAALEESLRR
jgi:hypothetical protein